MLKILVTNKKTGQQNHYNLRKEHILIGRQKICDIVLASPGVSRKHTQFVINKNLVEVEDLNSGNGTLLNQKKLNPTDRYPVQSGDIISIEEFDIEIENDLVFKKIHEKQHQKENSERTRLPDMEASLRKYDITDPDIIEIKMIKRVLGALDPDQTASLQVLTDAFKDKKIFFEEGKNEITVGRDPQCELTLNDHSVSRQHAKIIVKWGSHVIQDLQSKNGTYVNGEKIADETTLADGDEIVFGSIKAIFKNPQEFDFDAISKSIQEQKPKDEAVTPPETQANAAEKESSTEQKSQPSPQSEQPTPPPAAETQNNDTKNAKENSATSSVSEDSKKTTELSTTKMNKKAGLSNAEKVLLFLGLFILLASATGLFFLFKP